MSRTRESEPFIGGSSASLYVSYSSCYRRQRLQGRPRVPCCFCLHDTYRKHPKLRCNTSARSMRMYRYCGATGFWTMRPTYTYICTFICAAYTCTCAGSYLFTRTHTHKHTPAGIRTCRCRPGKMTFPGIYGSESKTKGL